MSSIPSKYRILSLDGGGLRTLVSLGILRRIERERPGFLDEVQLVAGTSSGALSALILAAASRSSEGLDAALRLWFAPDLFTLPLSNTLGALVGRKALTPNQAMARALTGVLGDKTLGELHRHVVIPAFQLDDHNPNEALRTWGLRVFHNLPGASSEQMGELLVDLALRSSAMPILSPVYQGYVDGGLFANNPTLAAVAQAIHAEVTTLDNLLVLSLGTGDPVTYMKGDNESWGYAKWLLNRKNPLALVSAFIKANLEAVDSQTRMLLPRGNSWRVNPPVPFNLGRSVEQQAAAIDRITERIDLKDALEWVDESGWMPPRRAPEDLSEEAGTPPH
ncbi:patatin-like phospholipase family protein [Vitiosangium sp. GDMCC 1.1324]|uniref:patatin-like phospholipase family protein n=1 Tax=Vitiosangium sp. (strain GDMCC 1.1324) TaxID=2138576 RepID=UPI000D39F97A|nr:patatin-like phospholipase family protein [Vitiosangium sp. GDMCC 1.1324]PTL83588.1 hypothetical protein DAT35_08845 [Vitiosangium sp. GDMCC 1.1324]